jgi:hypothetical protein
MKKTVNDLLTEWGMNESMTRVFQLANLAGGPEGRNPAYGQFVTVFRDDTNFYTYQIQDKEGNNMEGGPVNKLDIPGHPVPMNADAIKLYFRARGFMQNV